MNSFERFCEEKIPDKNIFTDLRKMEQLLIMVKNEMVT